MRGQPVIVASLVEFAEEEGRELERQFTARAKSPLYRMKIIMTSPKDGESSSLSSIFDKDYAHRGLTGNKEEVGKPIRTKFDIGVKITNE